MISSYESDEMTLNKEKKHRVAPGVWTWASIVGHPQEPPHLLQLQVIRAILISYLYSFRMFTNTWVIAALLHSERIEASWLRA